AGVWRKAWEDCGKTHGERKEHTSGAKAQTLFNDLSARLKSCPAQIRSSQSFPQAARLLRQDTPRRDQSCGKRTREKGKGCDIGYALAVSSCEGAKQRGGMHRHSP